MKNSKPKENIIKKYLPDIIIIIGVYTLSHSIFTEISSGFRGITTTTTDYGSLWGVVLIAIGINIAIRRYLSSNYKNKSEK